MYKKSVLGKIEINGYPIHYEKFGSGSEVILLIPGSLGNARYDFKPQLEGQNAFNLKKYTLIGIDLPGWGRSRPPERKYGLDVYNIDVDCCFKLMQNLGYKVFSIIGWSHGAKVALSMCHKNPNVIKCTVVMGVLIQASKQSLGALLMTRDITIWPKEQLDAYLEVYGDFQTIQLLWDQYLQFARDGMDMKYITEDNPDQYIIKPEELKSIRNPVLIIHGDRDPLIGFDQVQFCARLVPGAELQRFPEGGHDSHHVCAAKFKRSVENFFDSNDDCF